jgi:hypothetical protein
MKQGCFIYVSLFFYHSIYTKTSGEENPAAGILVIIIMRIFLVCRPFKASSPEEE